MKSMGIGGAEGNRTPDLCSAIAALSHLSYSPIRHGFSAANPASGEPLLGGGAEAVKPLAGLAAERAETDGAGLYHI